MSLAVSISSVVVAAAAVGATLLFGMLAAARAQYDMVFSLMDYVSRGEVGEARHRLSLALGDDVGDPAPEELAVLVKSLFIVLWAFQRINAVNSNFARSVLAPKGPVRLLQDCFSGWVGYWAPRLDKAERRLKLDHQAYLGARIGIDNLMHEWGLSGHP
jgi:hypothetical protein